MKCLGVDNHVERKACRWWKRERSQAHWCSERSFPLTPPSPLGRGRIARRAFVNPERLDSSQRGMRRSLSLRERARVRGNETQPTKTAGRILRAQRERVSESELATTSSEKPVDGRRTRGRQRIGVSSVPSPSPRPLPRGEGEWPAALRQSRAPRLVAARDAAFPLPGGEGKGEGERDAANQNSRKNFASSTRTPLRDGDDHHIERKACRWSKDPGSPAQWCSERSFPLTPPSPLVGRITRRPSPIQTAST